MIPEPPQPLSEPAALPRKASRQLRECLHFVSLLAEQTEALEQQDFPRVRELEALRSRLADEMRDPLAPETPVVLWIAGQIDDALSQLQAWITAERSARDQFSQLQDGSLPLVRGIHQRVGGGHYPPPDAAGARLDLRL